MLRGFVLLLLLVLPSSVHPDERVTIFVHDVQFDGFPAKLSGRMRTWGPVMAEEVRGVMKQHPGLIPMTLKTLKAQLGKQRMKETLACKADTACVNRIVENFGCSHSVFATVTYVSDDEAQLVLTHTSGDEQIGLAGPVYVKPDFKSMRAALRTQTAVLFKMAAAPTTPTPGVVVPPPTVDPGSTTGGFGAVTEAVADLSVTTRPKKGVRLELTPPKGKRIVSGSPYKNRRAEPGTWRVKATATGYAPYEETFNAPPDEITVKRIQLKKLGALSVIGKPKGSKVEITGPDRFRKKGGLPGHLQNLATGTYHIKVSRKGYPTFETDAEVNPGETTTVQVDLKKAPKVSGDMILIPAGKFWMGCNERVDKKCGSDEKPYHEVYLDAYYIDRHEVTVGDYRKCVTSGRCKAADTDRKYCNWKYSDREDHPINCVDWHRAKAYCEWKGGRLPTEAEWEKAARGTDGRIYPWGNEPVTCSRAIWGDGLNTDGCGRNSTWPVCSKPAGNSPYGLCDMAGNVWEWVNDWYDGTYYKGSPRRNPRGANSAKYRVLRGGSCYRDNPAGLRTSYRDWLVPVVSNNSLGFRCVRPSRQ